MKQLVAPQTLLFPYQKRFIADRSPFVLFEKSRRIGATWACGFLAMMECLSQNYDCWFSSTDEKNAREFVGYAEGFSRSINMILGQEFIRADRATSESILLPNGCRISALSSNPKALRGKQGLVILDEFAYHEDAEEMFTAAHGCTAQKGRLIEISTHNGPGTLFYRHCTDAMGTWSKHRTTIIDACNQGYAMRFARKFHHLGDPAAIASGFIDYLRKTSLNQAVFEQEFLCRPISLSSLFDSNQYDACILPDDNIPELLNPRRMYGPLFHGIDVGRTIDLTVCWTVEQLANPKSQGDWDTYDYRTVAIKPIKGMGMDAQYNMLLPNLSHPSTAGIGIDIGTQGRALADMIQAVFPATMMLSLGPALKSTMAERFAGYVQMAKISLPSTPWIREDLLSLRRSPGKTGVSYEGQTAASHCDAFWAAAMAIHAAFNSMGAIMV